MPDTIIEVRLQPRASKNEIVGFKGDVLWVRTTAAPVDGEANSALLKLLSNQLEIAKSDITIITGLRSRNKIVKLCGLERKTVMEKLNVRKEKE
jgi:uncharacterized protein (TIGR00251 family)